MKLSVLGFDGTIRYPPKQVWGNVEYSSWWSVGYMEVTREGEKKDACDPETRWLILRVKELRSVETSVAIYQPTKRNITEDLNLLDLRHPWENESNTMGLQDNHVVPVLRTGTIVHSQSVVTFVPDHFHTSHVTIEQASLILSPLGQSFIVHIAPYSTLVRDGPSCCSASLLADAHIALNFIFNLFKY